VKHDAKALSAESTEGNGNSRGPLRCAFATRAASGEVKGSGGRSLRLLGLAVVLIGLFSALFGASQASAFDEYVAAGEFGAFEFANPTAIAVDGATGNVLVVDSGQSKVQVWGPGGSAATHLLSFGSGLSSPYGIAVDQGNGDVYVSNSAGDETQTVRVANADAGTYTLGFEGQTTAPIAFDAGAAAIQAALEALSNIGAGDVVVEGGGPLDPAEFAATSAVTFTGTLAQTDVAELSADDSGLSDDPAAPEPAKTTVNTAHTGGVDEIARFQPDNRANPTTYARDPGFISPAQGSNASTGQIGSFASPVAVDPANGDLLVADTGNEYVSRFDANGGFLSSFNGADTPGGVFLNLQDVTVGGGVAYVLDTTGPYSPETGNLTGVSRTMRFGGAGNFLGALPNDEGMATARSLAYGMTSGSVFVAEQRVSLPSQAGRLHIYRNGTQFQRVGYDDSGALSALVGLASDDSSPTSSGRVYGLRAIGFLGVLGRPGVQVFDYRRFPDVTLDPATNIEQTSMHLSGTVDPIRGASWSFYFEYCSGGGSGCASTPSEERIEAVTEGEPPRAVEADLTGLDPNTTYEVKLVATNGDGSHDSAVQTVTTSASAPAVTTGNATNRSTTDAILHGTVNPLGSQSGYHFEYGTTSAYGSRVPGGHDVAVGRGQNPVSASLPVSGLQPATTYHYRLVAVSSAGTEAGEDRTFTTLAAVDLPQRSYELVSPAEKGGNNVYAAYGMQASEDGDRFAFFGATALSGLSETAPKYPRYVAQRSSGGWSSKGTDPPQLPPTRQAIRTTLGLTDDASKAIVGSLRAFAPGAIEGQANIYLRDVATGAYTTMATTPNTNDWLQNQFGTNGGPGPEVFVQATPDHSHILLYAGPVSFLPGVPNGALYDFTSGQLQVASVSPAGTPITGSGMGIYDRARNVISRDGLRVIFGSSAAAYLRSGGISRPMSESRRSSDPPGTLVPASPLGGDRDLEHVFLLSRNLTDSSEPGVFSLYRYDTETEGLELLTKASNESNAADFKVLQISADGSTIYFMSQATLTPDAPNTGEQKLYVWRDGNLSLVASFSPLYDTSPKVYWASPSGRYFAFLAATPNLTGYDTTNPACTSPATGENGACGEVYRYDAGTSELICVSCRPDGEMPTVGAYLGTENAESGTHSFLRAVNDRGQVFFSTAEQLVRSDTNSYSDVYEYNDNTGDRLVSTGIGTGSVIAEVSADGSNVFFTTQDKLVGIDTDKATDVYDARVNGGLASQNPPPPREECIRDDCKETPNKGPELPFGGSEGLSGPENVKEAARQRCGKGRHARKVKGKQRCVKQKKQSKKNRTNNNRRQGR
jgi:hypothetical protein